MMYIHWAGKHRGPDFEPLNFELLKVESPSLRDSRGRFVPTVIARPLSDAEAEHKAVTANADASKLLSAMTRQPGASVAALASACEWLTSAGQPHKSKIHRAMKELERAGLVNKELSAWVVTQRGERAAGRQKP